MPEASRGRSGGFAGTDHTEEGEAPSQDATDRIARSLRLDAEGAEREERRLDRLRPLVAWFGVPAASAPPPWEPPSTAGGRSTWPWRRWHGLTFGVVGTVTPLVDVWVEERRLPGHMRRRCHTSQPRPEG